MRIETSAISAMRQYANVNKAEKTGSAAGMGSDRVELSNEAVAFGALVRQVKLGVSETTEEYAARVDDIAQRVKSGSYKVSPELIADALLS